MEIRDHVHDASRVPFNLDRTRMLPPPIRNVVLKGLGRRIFHANYRPLREQA